MSKASVMKFVLAFVAFTLPLIGCNAQSTRTLITRQCSIRANEYRVPTGAPKSPHDPRAERYYTSRIPASERRMRFEYSAVYQIKSAKRTTIAQLLNTDPGKSGADKRVPVLFLVAFKSGNSVKVCSFERCFTTWPNLPTKFRITITTSGKTAKVVINGRPPKYFDLHRPRNGRVRTRGYHHMRFGVYHHDIRNGKANSSAAVVITGIRTKGF